MQGFEFAILGAGAMDSILGAHLARAGHSVAMLTRGRRAAQVRSEGLKISRTGRMPATGHLQRVVFNQNMEEIRRESMLRELRQRIREVREGPDGFLYLLTDEDDGALLRLEPAP